MKITLIFITLVLIITSCNTKQEPVKNETNENTIDTLSNFSTVNSFNFTNTLKETELVNYFTYEYAYNGGGIAVADFNLDGLQDIYMVSNQNEDQVFINQGKLKFNKIGINKFDKSENGWCSGVTIVDIDNNGYPDIYVSRAGPHKNELRRNKLYKNNGDLTFTECAKEYGIDDDGYTTQATFFDYDKDGDLDLFVLNHHINKVGSKEKTIKEINALIKSGKSFTDKLYQNENGSFIDVTRKANLLNHAFGLSVSIVDCNNDGWEDLYITNDYVAPDYLYVNQTDGTFKEEIKTRTKHVSNYSMGSDVMDINNDGYQDIVTLDMASENHIRSKRNMGAMSNKAFWRTIKVGYQYQYMFNTLQLNNGNGTFSDVANLAGIAKTDWSWSTLINDFNNDGMNDIFISNGYLRDARDNDFNNTLAAMKPEELSKLNYQDKLNMMPATKLANYMYQNKGELSFENKAENWGLGKPMNSQGAAYADFDNDGDLDLIVNNINEPSVLFENNNNSDKFISIELTGNNQNKDAIGTKIEVTQNETTYTKYLYVTRGFQSSVDKRVHFGLNSTQNLNINITWPDGLTTILNDIKPSQILKIAYNDVKKVERKSSTDNNELFTKVDAQKIGINYAQDEYIFDDFKKEILLPHKMSQLGPFSATADVNGDGLEDIFIGASRKFSGKLYIQNTTGTFTLNNTQPWKTDRNAEDMGALFFDADNDGDKDLYVVSGGNELDYADSAYQDRLYLNNGKGKFTKSFNALPKMVTSGETVIAADYDKDGDLDLFIGGRQTPQYYPFAPRSFLLQNNGGKFIDVTNSIAIDLMGPGLITGASFEDIDNDNDLDLITVGEWMSINIFENQEGAFRNITKNIGLDKTVGWWRSITPADVNGDGKMDFICGNIGKNNKYHPTPSNPLHIYTYDFDNTGSYDIVLAKNQNNICYPVRGRQCTSEQMPSVSTKFKNYFDYATADINTIYSKDSLNKALHYEATMFESIVLINKGGWEFEQKVLSNYAQVSPLNAVIAEDINKDGNIDILGVGNYHQAEVETARYDAGIGVLLYGDGKGNFKYTPNYKTGFFAPNDARDLKKVKGKNGKSYYMVINNLGFPDIFIPKN